LRCAAAATVPSNSSKPEFDKIFVFGDSYVDIGNRDPYNTTYTAIGRVNQNWAPPYGRTHPGAPAGRFSDGKVLSDHLSTTSLINPSSINYPSNL
jgi:phospholipase/lecithinase/hemolysin